MNHLYLYPLFKSISNQEISTQIKIGIDAETPPHTFLETQNLGTVPKICCAATPCSDILFAIVATVWALWSDTKRDTQLRSSFDMFPCVVTAQMWNVVLNVAPLGSILGRKKQRLQQHEEEGGQSSLHLKLILHGFTKVRSHGKVSRMPRVMPVQSLVGQDEA